MKRNSVVALLVLGLWAGAASAQDWPQFRGADRTGISSSKDLLAQWPEDGPKVLWKATGAGDGFSSMSFSAGLMYTMGNREDGEYVIAYDVTTGEEAWSQRTGPGYPDAFGNGPRSTPTIDWDRLYVLGATGDLWCLSAKDGKVRWHIDLIGRFGGESMAEKNKGKMNLTWGISESPIIEGKMVICNTGSKGGSYVAFNKLNGDVIWRSKGLDDVPGYASAVVAEVGGVRQLINYTSSRVVSIRVSDGQLLWDHSKTAKSQANYNSPILYTDGDKQQVLLPGQGLALIKLTAVGEGTFADEVYFESKIGTHHGGAILVDDHVYMTGRGGMSCIDAKTGEIKWQDRGVGAAALTYADGKLIAQGQDGTIALIDANPEGYKELSRFSIEPAQDCPQMRKKVVWAHPVIVDQKLFVRNGREITCYDIKVTTDNK